MVSRKAISRFAGLGALGAFVAVLLLMSGGEAPDWARTVAGGLGVTLCAVILLVVTYVILLVLGIALARGEHIKKFSLRNFEFEFSDDTEDLKEIDLRLSEDMKALNQLVKDLSTRVDELDAQLQQPGGGAYS